MSWSDTALACAFLALAALSVVWDSDPAFTMGGIVAVLVIVRTRG